ncbi:hypothetical protein EZS27_014537 [termite gut metagenome]|uniref:Uncharacterized protein n=1 Tax=termite gut metagenome TaxID=433724 RepID=A0A5J4RUW8_9ZZZZ
MALNHLNTHNDYSGDVIYNSSKFISCYYFLFLYYLLLLLSMSSTLVCIKAFKINFKFIPQIRKCSIGCVKQSFFLYIIFRHYPFLLRLTPNGFGNIQMRRTGRRKVQKQSSMLPIGYPLSNDISFTYAGIIQYNNSFLITSCYAVFLLREECSNIATWKETYWIYTATICW